MTENAASGSQVVLLEFSYCYEDFWPGGRRWTFEPAYFVRWMGPWAVVMGGVVLALMSFRQWGGQMNAAKWIGLAVTPMAFLVMVRVNLFYRNRQHRRAWMRQHAAKTFKLTLSDAGLDWHDGATAVHEKWTTYQNCRETATEFMLTHVNQKKPMILLPKRVIPERRLEEVRGLIACHVPLRE